jgi:hypothetical protein
MSDRGTEETSIARVSRGRGIALLVVSLALFGAALVVPIVLINRHLDDSTHILSVIVQSPAIPFLALATEEPIGPELQKISIVFFALILLVAGRLLPRRRVLIQRTVTLLLILLTVWAFRLESWDQTISLLRGQYIQFWNSYHYYFGSKYFSELGYHQHYAYTLKAAEEGALKLGNIEKVRNLEDYRLESRGRALRRIEGRKDFSVERWEQFKNDLRVFSSFVPVSAWSRMLQDHGCNGTPFGLTSSGVLARLLPLTNRYARTALFGLDQAFLLVAFVCIGWAFGLRWGVVSALFFLTMHVNVSFTVGGFIRYDWFSATLISFALFHKGHLKASAPFLAYAAMVRVFPAFLIVGPAVQWLYRWIRTKSMDRKPLRMFVIFGLCCAFFLAIGALNRHGFGGWKTFASNIGQHAAQQHLGSMRVGHKHLFVDDYGTPRLDTNERRQAFEKQEDVFRATQVALIVVFFLVVLRRNRDDAYLMGFMFVFLVLVLSRYYWALAGLLLLFSERPGLRWRNVMSDILLLTMVMVVYAFSFTASTRYAIHMPTSYFLLGYFLFVGGSFLAQDALFRCKALPQQSGGVADRRRGR